MFSLTQFHPSVNTAVHTDHRLCSQAGLTLSAQMMQDNDWTQAANSPVWLKPQTPQPSLFLGSMLTASLCVSPFPPTEHPASHRLHSCTQLYQHLLQPIKVLLQTIIFSNTVYCQVPWVSVYYVEKYLPFL